MTKSKKQKKSPWKPPASRQQKMLLDYKEHMTILGLKRDVAVLKDLVDNFLPSIIVEAGIQNYAQKLQEYSEGNFNLAADVSITPYNVNVEGK
jgi:hypothetical protein